MKSIYFSLLILVTTQLGFANGTCSTFFGGHQAINDMTAKALSTRQRVFDSVASVKSTNYRYEKLENNNTCEFSFRFYVDLAFEFKDLPGCISHFKVSEVVTYYDAIDGMATRSRTDSYNVEHTFDDIVCN